MRHGSISVTSTFPTFTGALALGSSVNGTPSISKSLDSGATWYLLSTGVTTQASRTPSHDGTLNICTASTVGGVYNCREITGRQNLTLSGLASANTTAFLNGKFWAIGTNGGLSSSVDGQNWTANFSIPNTVSLTKIAFGNGTYVVTGASGIAYSSVDGGETWTAISHTLGAVTFNVLLFTNGTWVIANATTTNLLVSTDGVNFVVRANAPSSTIGGIVTKDGFVLWSSSNVTVSPNGITWSTSTFGGSVSDVAYGNGVYMAVGGASTSSFCAVSADALAWTPRPIPYAGAMTTVAYASGSFLVTGSPAGVSCLHFQTSTNGLFWNTRAGPLSAMPQAHWISIPNVGAFEYGVTNGGGAPHAIVAYPNADQFRVPNIPPSSSYDGNAYIKAR